MEIRDRVVKMLRVKPSKLRNNPFNWRVHPEKQKEVLKGILGEVGIAGVQLVRELEDGSYMLIDGHLRKETYPPNQRVPVVLLDVTEDEAKKLLAAYDPLSQLATTDKDALGKLLRDVETGDVALASLFSDLAGGVKALDPEELELDLNVEEVPEADVAAVPASHVRMFQLFLNVETLPKFQEMISTLGEAYGITNSTDVVFRAMKEAVRAHRKAGKGSPQRSRS